MKIKLRYIYLLAFVIVAYILLPMMNGDYLFTIQDNSVFINGRTFMLDMTSRDGGWLAWVSSYLTQFFYHPWLGSTILIACWVAIYFLTLHVFGIKDKWSPLALILPALLLFQLLDYGYWIYYTKTPGFPFQLTLILLLSLLCTWIFLPLVKRIPKTIHYEELYAVHLFVLVLVAQCLLHPDVLKLYQHSFPRMTTLTDKNFHHEMRMYRALDEFRFDDVLKEMPKAKEEPPTHLMVLYKNIALMHTGHLTDMFKTNNCGTTPAPYDTLQIRIEQLGAPLIYYQFGQINYAYRWAMENSVQYRQSFRNLKMMARCAIFNGEFDVAMKYLTLLKTSPFHRNWAREHEAWIQNSTRFIQSRDFQAIAPLINDDINTLDNDEGLCERYLLEHFADLLNASTPKLEEVVMCLSLWTKDDYAFCIHFYDYVQRHPNEAIPELYQQGAILLGTADTSPITLDRFRFDTVVSERYNQFAQDYNQLSRQNLDDKALAQRLQPLYGDTYWWWYYFGE